MPLLQLPSFNILELMKSFSCKCFLISILISSPISQVILNCSYITGVYGFLAFLVLLIYNLKHHSQRMQGQGTQKETALPSRSSQSLVEEKIRVSRSFPCNTRGARRETCIRCHRDTHRGSLGSPQSGCAVELEARFGRRFVVRYMVF